jgi:nucleoside-diphosphate-sugar epimerase
VPEVLNVATGHGVTMLELIAEIGRQCGIEPDIAFAPGRLGDARFLVGDPARAHDYLGFHTATDLAAGIAATLQALDEALV